MPDIFDFQPEIGDYKDLEMTEKEYRLRCAVVRDVWENQNEENLKLIIPIGGKDVVTMQDIEDHFDFINSHFDQFLDHFLLYLIKNENNEYIFKPKCATWEAEEDLESVRDFMRRLTAAHIVIRDISTTPPPAIYIGYTLYISNLKNRAVIFFPVLFLFLYFRRIYIYQNRTSWKGG